MAFKHQDGLDAHNATVHSRKIENNELSKREFLEERDMAKEPTEKDMCGNCAAEINGKPKYCPNCGDELAWE